MCLRHVYQMSSTADRVSALITILPTTDNIVENFEFKVNDSHEYDCEKQDFFFHFQVHYFWESLRFLSQFNLLRLEVRSPYVRGLYR